MAELMTIKTEGDGISMVLRHFGGALIRAWEQPTAPMGFTAASCEPQSVVFKSQSEHVGEHLSYSRSGKTLTITGDFPDHEVWRMIKAGE